MSLANTPEPPYIAVIFSSLLRGEDGTEPDGYGEAADRMAALAKEQPGYLGFESARGEDGVGVTVSYWRDDAAVLAWRRHLEHAQVRAKGTRDWYASYRLRVARVERAAAFETDLEANLEANLEADNEADTDEGERRD